MTDPAIELADVSVAFGDVTVLKNVSLSVDRGELLGLVGPNGAGKTTLLRTINGVLDPDTGTVHLGDASVGELTARQVSRRVATVPQDTAVAFEFSVEDVVRMGRTPYRSRTDLVADERDRDAVEAALERTGMAALRDRSIAAVSGGERQRAFVARALAQDAPALVLDEPTASLDINHQVQVLELVADLVGEGKTAIAAIHDLDLAARYCDRLALLADGEVGAVGSPETVLTDNNLRPAFETRTAVTPDAATGAPSVTAIAEPDRDRDTHVHVLGGGRTAARAIAALRRAGFRVTAGPLPAGDAALSVARQRDVDVIETPPLSGPSEADRREARARCRRADVTVLADPVLGPGTHLLALAEASDRTVLIERRPLAARNRAGEAGRERYRDLASGASTASLRELVPAVTAAASVRASADDD